MSHDASGTSHQAELKSIINAFISGAQYGVKVRLPHAFVMTFLFKRHLTTKTKLRSIRNLTFEHASNLAAFATLYKVSSIHRLYFITSSRFFLYRYN